LAGWKTDLAVHGRHDFAKRKVEDQLTIGSTEHYEMIAGFEKAIARTPIRTRFDKEPREDWKKGRIYQDMNTNDLFKAYAAGYAHGRCEYSLRVFA
jgi:hypothetical protein